MSLHVYNTRIIWFLGGREKAKLPQISFPSKHTSTTAEPYPKDIPFHHIISAKNPANDNKDFTPMLVHQRP